jgi:hypothetical protein
VAFLSNSLARCIAACQPSGRGLIRSHYLFSSASALYTTRYVSWSQRAELAGRLSSKTEIRRYFCVCGLRGARPWLSRGILLLDVLRSAFSKLINSIPSSFLTCACTKLQPTPGALLNYCLVVRFNEDGDGVSHLEEDSCSRRVIVPVFFSAACIHDKKERQHVNSIRTCVCMVRSTTFFFAKSGTSTFALTLTTATCTQPATDEFCMRLVRK